MIKKLVILGHSGFLGKHLYDTFLKDPFYKIYGFSSAQIDLSESALKVNDFIDDAYLIMAASSLVKNKNLISFWKDVAMFNNIVRLPLFYKVKHLIYISSTAIYGRHSDFPITENSLPNPDGFYGLAKFIGELIFNRFCVWQNIRLTILRPGILYGYGDVKSPLYRFINSIRMEKAIKMHGDQSTRLVFTHKEDLRTVIGLIINQNQFGDYNVVSNGDGIPLIDLTKTIFNLCGARTGVIFEPSNEIPIDIRFDISKFKTDFPSFKFIDFEEGIKDYLIP